MFSVTILIEVEGCNINFGAVHKIAHESGGS